MSKMKLYDNPEQNMNYFDYTPDEILYKIISDLPRFDVCTLAKVCQRFQRVCRDKRLWNDCLSLVEQEITYSQIEMLFTSSCPIKELDLSRSWTLDADDHRWAKSSNFLMTLEKLNLKSAADIDDMRKYEVLRTHVLKRSRTKELILDATRPYDNHPGNYSNFDMIRAISKHENLEMLSMERTTFKCVGVDEIEILFNGCIRLKELNLTKCYMSPEVLRAFCNHIPETVEKLVMLDIYFNERETLYLPRLEDYENYLETIGVALADSFEVLFHRLKTLKYFGAPYLYLQISAITDRMIQHFQYQSLETLHLCKFDIEHIFDLLEEMEKKPKKIAILWTCTCAELEEGRAQRQLSRVLAQLEKFREASTGIDLEVYDAKMNRL